MLLVVKVFGLLLVVFFILIVLVGLGVLMGFGVFLCIICLSFFLGGLGFFFFLGGGGGGGGVLGRMVILVIWCWGVLVFICLRFYYVVKVSSMKVRVVSNFRWVCFIMF